MVVRIRVISPRCIKNIFEYQSTNIKAGYMTKYFVNINKAVNYAKEEMKKYKCTLCEYVYDPEVGDPDGEIEPGTAIEDLPDDWLCPVCGAGKADFEELKD